MFKFAVAQIEELWDEEFIEISKRLAERIAQVFPAIVGNADLAKPLDYEEYTKKMIERLERMRKVRDRILKRPIRVDSSWGQLNCVPIADAIDNILGGVDVGALPFSRSPLEFAKNGAFKGADVKASEEMGLDEDLAFVERFWGATVDLNERGVHDFIGSEGNAKGVIFLHNHDTDLSHFFNVANVEGRVVVINYPYILPSVTLGLLTSLFPQEPMYKVGIGFIDSSNRQATKQHELAIQGISRGFVPE